MSRKKKRGKRTRRTPRPSFPARFAVGAQVRVKPGTRDPDFPDIPLGGWAGTVEDVDRRTNPPEYLVAWDLHTLDHIHPVYRKRCERDGLDCESMWLDETELEVSTGEPSVIEQPTALVLRPLRPNDPDDRVRAVFALTSDDDLPAVNEENLRRYRQYLETNLSLPFPGAYFVVTGAFRQTRVPVTVLRLLAAEDATEDEGLLCQADEQGALIELPLIELDARSSPTNRRLLEDYVHWFGNAPVGDFSATAAGPGEPLDSAPAPPGRWPIAKAFATFGLAGTVYGAVLGALLRVVEGTSTGALVGAVFLGLAAGLLGTSFGRTSGEMHGVRYRGLLGGVLGSVLGAVAGALAGALVVAFVGTVPGGLGGALLGRLVTRKAVAPWVGALVGALAGAAGLAFSRNPDGARAGLLQGAWIGAAAGAFVVLAVVAPVVLIARARRHREDD